MEENTEPHMETDVSSTTKDVPETQEVTGSDGNVEMIIVIEKMEDEPSADEPIDEQPSSVDKDTNCIVTIEDNPPDTESEVPKSPVKSPIKSPTKIVIKLPTKSPKKSPGKSNVEEQVSSPQGKPEIDLTVEEKILQHNEVPPLVEKQQTEAVDSSRTEPIALQSEDQSTPAQRTNKEVQNNTQKSPMKDVQTLASPTKETLLIDKTAVNGKVQSNDTSKVNPTSNKTINNDIPIDITETSNDSQIEILSDVSEKEHKSISRELKSLINSAKESKIISECTQLTSKTRKSRNALDVSSSSLNSSLVEPNKVHDTRRHSVNSNCSEKSDKVVLKRSMRSQNPEFVSKVKQFLNSVTGKCNKGSDDSDEDLDPKDKPESLEPIIRTPPKVKKFEHIVLVTEKNNKLRRDLYCWRCHWAIEQQTNEKLHPPMNCTVCPRSFHYKCLTGTERNKINVEKNWVCPECMVVLQAESSESRSLTMKKISLGMLCDLLKHALERMMDLNGVEPFMQPVDRTAFPDYDKYVVHPMDLSLMKANIEEGLYGSTEAFVTDAQWILHNSIIFNTLQSKLTAGARALVRSCRAEMGEIEACPECYAAAHARRPTWFTDVCSTPHILFWAKLKGFPFWPAKGMSVNSAGLVDVRFFGAHDRAWVPAKDCFLYSEKDPNNFRTKRQDIVDSMQEAEEHIRNISRKYGRFVYPPFKTPFNPNKMYEQLKMMIPSFEGEVGSLVKEKSSPAAAKEKSRSNSKSSFNEGALQLDSSDSDGEELQRLYDLLDKDSDMSETEDTSALASRKMADGAEIAKMEEDETSIMEREIDTSPAPKAIDPLASTPTSSSRKRRRSELEEAIITIIETSGSNSNSSNCSEKRKKIDPDTADNKKPEQSEPSSSKVEDNPPPVDQSKGETIEDTPSKTNESLKTVKDSDATNTTEKEKLRVTPIRIALVTKEKRKTRNSSSKDTTAKIITPIKDKEKEQEKTTPVRQKSTRSERLDKTPTTKTENNKTPTIKTENKKEKAETPKADKTSVTKSEKIEKTSSLKLEKVEKTPNDRTTREERITREERSRSSKRRNSRSSRSTNSRDSTKSSDKTEKKSEKVETISKEKTRENNSSGNKEKETENDRSKFEKHISAIPVADLLSPRSVKDRLQFNDDSTLAVLAQETGQSVVVGIHTGLPTISCVRSLSTTAQLTASTTTKTTTIANTISNTIDITEEATSDSSIFTPTSTDSVTTMKDAVSKLQRLRNEPEPVVGRVGVRAFARMTSPDRDTSNDEVQVEIKAEPIELDDADRHMEKMDLMNAFRLRPVNPQPAPSSTMNLRDVRINKVVVTPLNAKKTTTVPNVPKTPEVRPRAKKTFPQPKKPDEGRSELNSKNSMVYIPIQPPMTQAPVRLPRPQPASSTVSAIVRPPVTSAANNLVNTVTTPLMQSSSSQAGTSSSSAATSSASVAAVPTVHTVPLMTSVNGQWMFSFQPVMSVGAIDNGASSPLLNGVSERNSSSALATLTPSAAAAPAAASAPAPPITVLTRTPAENTPGEPPRLQQRPVLMNPLDANTPIGTLPTPSTAGPVTAKLNQNAVKLTDFFRTLIEDSLEKLNEPWSQVTTLKLQLEQDHWKHQQELKELKYNQDLMVSEMRASFEKEKMRIVSEARQTAQVELEAAVKLAKSKQWCAYCRQEAQFYCCWNTSYCDLPCQRAHWSQHFANCQQRSQESSNGEPPRSPENRLQAQPEMPKTCSAPTLTVGGKLAPSRAFTTTAAATATDTHSAKKASIIVSMVEDTSGNQTMKCVGTYKPPQTNQIAPIIINKQIMNSEESANKKVVSSSGGYLIVGASNSSSTVSPARRTHTIQYYT